MHVATDLHLQRLICAECRTSGCERKRCELHVSQQTGMNSSYRETQGLYLSTLTHGPFFLIRGLWERSRGRFLVIVKSSETLVRVCFSVFTFACAVTLLSFLFSLSIYTS